MRLMIALFVLALTASNACSQENPLAKLTGLSTLLSCSSGFAEVTYAYKRDKQKGQLVTTRIYRHSNV